MMFESRGNSSCNCYSDQDLLPCTYGHVSILLRLTWGKKPEPILLSTVYYVNVVVHLFLFQENVCPLADSSSDYSQRTGFDFPSLQQEFRTTPEGARRETDDPLPDRIKVLLPSLIINNV